MKFSNETIYIAGPECFFENGTQVLDTMRRVSEQNGFHVSLPNDTPLNLTHENLKKNAHEIFENLKVVMNETSVIISDLDSFRGSEPDSGTVFEIGMAYARGIKSYGHTRDKRPLVWKDQQIYMKDSQLFDEADNLHPYPYLPFSPNLLASTKIIEGNYFTCLEALMTDLAEESKEPREELALEQTSVANDQKTVFLAINDRYKKDFEHAYQAQIDRLEKQGYRVLLPDFTPILAVEGSYEKATHLLKSNVEKIKASDIVIADLNDFRGFECSNDVAFETGFAFQLGKELYGFMANTDKMLDKIPHLEIDGKYRDFCGRDVEDFDYPINLMFACAMPIYAGDIEDALTKVFK